ncbi:MAG: general secretion pathway protein GspK [Akkermansiaceae bacterium]|nr:general secretion pathway protein GspK [Akkermansiaceae bacterium]
MTRRRRHPRGASLLAVILLIAILAMATMTTLRVVSFDMEIATAKIHGSRAKQVAEMGIAIGSNPSVKRSDPLLHYFNEETGERYDVRIISEGGRFNINSIVLRDDKPLLRSIFIDWGLDLDTAGAIADAFGDWVDADDNAALNGAEKEWYESQGRINQPFNRPFYNLDEVRLVRGMELVEAVRPDWRDWFTIYSGGGLDVNDAEAELIAAAAEVNVDQAKTIVETVRGPDGIRDTDDDVPFQNPQAALQLLGIDGESRPDILARFSANDSTVRIESTGSADGARRRVNAILRNRSGRPALLEKSVEILPSE